MKTVKKLVCRRKINEKKRRIFISRNINKYVYIFCSRIRNFCVLKTCGYCGKGKEG